MHLKLMPGFSYIYNKYVLVFRLIKKLYCVSEYVGYEENLKKMCSIMIMKGCIFSNCNDQILT